MWKCPKCGGEFEEKGQEHCCVPITTIDEYIEAQPEAIRPLLAKVRETIRAVALEAIEKISWRMPTFWQGENLIHFAVFASRLAGYKTSKGAIQFPLNKPIDYALIAEIAKWRVAQVEGKLFGNGCDS